MKRKLLVSILLITLATGMFYLLGTKTSEDYFSEGSAYDDKGDYKLE